MTPDATPPRAALWLLDRLLSPAAAEAITGDLAEDFARLAQRRGTRAARRWFWRQTIGIRRSLGARRLEVARLVLGRGVALIGVGLAVGLAASALAARFLETQLFETAVLDPATYATAAAGLLAAGLLAHILPLRRAVRVDPNLILRGD